MELHIFETTGCQFKLVEIGQVETYLAAKLDRCFWDRHYLPLGADRAGAGFMG